MRVLHVISSGGMYGAEAVILNLSRTLHELEDEEQAGHSSELAVFTSAAQPNHELYAAARREGVLTHPIACEGQLDRSVPAALRALAPRLCADIVHAHGYKADLYCWAAFRKTAVPLVSTCHTWYDNDLAVRLYGSLDRAALRAFDGVVAVSEEVRERLLSAGVHAAKVRVISNGIDLRPFSGRRSVERSAGPLRVGLVGRLAPEKGCDLFVRAAAQVLAHLPEVHFLIAGDGSERERLEGLIAELGLGKKVTLAGRCDDMPAWYQSLDLLVSSSRQEGLPIALLEAMASALPIVATKAGEVRTLVVDDVTGKLVEVGDVPGLAEAILELLRNSSLRRSLGAAGRERVASRYSAKQMTAEYLSFYQDVVHRRSAIAARRWA